MKLIDFLFLLGCKLFIWFSRFWWLLRIFVILKFKGIYFNKLLLCNCLFCLNCRGDFVDFFVNKIIGLLFC